MATPHKQFEKTFWYYDDYRAVKWGVTLPPKVHPEDLRGFNSENEAMRAYLDWLDEHPQYKAPEQVNVWPGSEIFVDFDGTIYKGPMLTGMVPDEYPPDPVAVKTLQELKAAGMKIVLYSCRTNPAVIGDNAQSTRLTQFMADFCSKYEIPYDAIEPFKPHYRVLIDDRALDGKDWAGVRRGLGMAETKG